MIFSQNRAVSNVGRWLVVAGGLTAATPVLPSVAQEQPLPANGGQAEVDSLAARSDPTADDWPSEILHMQAKHQLKELAKGLVRFAGMGLTAERRARETAERCT